MAGYSENKESYAGFIYIEQVTECITSLSHLNNNASKHILKHKISNVKNKTVLLLYKHMHIYESRYKKTYIQQTGLYEHRKWLEAKKYLVIVLSM